MKRRQLIGLLTATLTGCIGEDEPERDGASGFGEGGVSVMLLANAPEDAEYADISDESLRDVPEIRDAVERVKDEYGDNVSDVPDEGGVEVVGSVTVTARGETPEEREERTEELSETLDSLGPRCDFEPVGSLDAVCLSDENFMYALVLNDPD